MTARPGSSETLAAAAMLAAALAALGGAGWTAHVNTREVLATSQQVLHTQRVLTEVERVESSMLWVQGVHRAFVISLDPRYKREYARLLPEVYDELDRLAELVRGDNSQAARLAQVRAAVARKTAVIIESFKLIDAHGFRRDEQTRLLERASITLESLRGVATDMESQERRLLADRLEIERAAAARALAAQLTAQIAAGLFLTAAIAILLLQLRRRREAEQALLVGGRELKRSNEELEQFAYAASHDLQEPLRKVANYAQLLERRYQGRLGEDADRYIGFVVDGAKRMRELINDLLALSRVRTRPIEPRPIESSDVVDAALANLEEAIREASATVRRGPLPRLLADETQLLALFQNLLGNAVKFHAKDRTPVVRVEASPQDGMWLFSIMDNGIGIAPEHFDKIFLAFQRLNPRGEYPGTGIGLALCKRVVEAHGGRIWVESAPGRGTTFKFTLPGTP